MSVATVKALPGNASSVAPEKHHEDVAVERRGERVVFLSAEQAAGAVCVVCGDAEPPEGKTVPVHTSHSGTWACADCAEVAARRSGRPWWQNRPCDPWCHGRHPLRDDGPDRDCLSEWQASIPLSLCEQERDQAGHVSPHYAEVYLERGQREIEARVVLLTPGHMPEGLSLTLVEGERLAEALSSAVHLAGGA